MMDPIAVLQSRIEQLEAKLGLASSVQGDGQQGDTVSSNLLNASQAINNVTAGHEKLPEAMHRASELNNYTDPNLLENVSNSNSYPFKISAAICIELHWKCLGFQLLISDS